MMNTHWFTEQVDHHLDALDEGGQQEAEEEARTEQTTDELQHNLEWKNTLHRMQYPPLYP